MTNWETETALYNIGFALFTLLAIPFAIVPTAFALAIFTYVTGIALAPWVATIAAFPLAIRIARSAMGIVHGTY